MTSRRRRARFEVKSASTVGGIDGTEIQQVCADEAKQWVRDLMGEPQGNRIQKAGLLAKYSLGIAQALLRRAIDLEQRIAQLESLRVSKSLDLEAYGEMESMADRLDRMESSLQEIADNGLRYRGYWQQGKKARRGDAYTHDGSLWWAVRATEDRTCNESMDWQVAVRKGRDAR